MEGLHVRGLPKARLSLGEPLIEEVLGLHLVFHCPQLPLDNSATQSKA